MSTLHPTLGPSRHRNVALLGILVGLLPTTTFAALAGWHYVAFPIVGQADDQLFGVAIADAGDVNGDGYTDALVGAPGQNNDRTYVGRAYLFFGGPNADATPDVTFHGSLPGDKFGRSVAGVGDVNGDGYDDVVTLAQSEVVLYFGGAPMNDTADLMYDFGGLPPYFDVAGAGDVNHDGFADIIVSVIKPFVLSNAYIYYGGAAVNLIPDVILSEGAATDWFGMSVAKGGNLNGDVYSDVLVGSSIGNSDTVFAYNGGNPMNATKDRSFPGRYVSGLARWNGDSRRDFMIGGGGIVTIYSELHAVAGSCEMPPPGHRCEYAFPSRAIRHRRTCSSRQQRHEQTRSRSDQQSPVASGELRCRNRGGKSAAVDRTDRVG